MKTIAISQSNYLPWAGYFKLIDSVDEFIFFDEVQYTRNEVGNTSNRDDIGFVVIERTESGKLIARYMFKHFSEFTIEVLRLPLN